jgi:hypothetical protein
MAALAPRVHALLYGSPEQRTTPLIEIVIATMAKESLHDAANVIATMATKLRGFTLPRSAADKVADR